MKYLSDFSEFLNESKLHPYMQGLSKSTQKKKKSQMAKQSKMSDDDPEAYKPLPGDSKKTKPSKYTKKFDQMFNETTLDNPFYDPELDKDHVSVDVDNDHPNGFPGGSPKQVEEDYDIAIIMHQGNKSFTVTGQKDNVKAYLDDYALSHLLDDDDMNEASIKSPTIEKGLKNKLEKIKEKNPSKYKKVTLGILRQVMKRGMAAWKGGHRPGAGEQQWGYARVNSFLTGGKTIGTTANPGPDGDLGKRAGLI